MTAIATPTRNRRRHRRVPLVCDVWQRTDYSQAIDGALPRVSGLAGRTLNLSDGGALVQVTELPEGGLTRPRNGQEIDLTLALPRATADTFLLEHVKLSGQVVRVQGPCPGACTAFAIRFQDPIELGLD
jgi:hypothetical protein